MKADIINSLKDLQSLMPAIIQQYGSDNELTQIALANPIIALERIGLQFTGTAKAEIEQYVRFGKQGITKMQGLRDSINKHLGRDTDLHNVDQLSDALMHIIEQRSNDQPPLDKEQANHQVVKSAVQRHDLVSALHTKSNGSGAELEDGLQFYVSHHPVFAQLIEYRKMQADNPPFTSPQEIPVIEERLKNLPLLNVVFKLQKKRKDQS